MKMVTRKIACAGSPRGGRRFPGFSPDQYLDGRRKLSLVWERLQGQYQVPGRPDGPLLDGLIRVLLSQNTTDANSDAAFLRLKERFPDWEEVERASPGEVEEAIRPAGISRVRASRIKEILGALRKERGALDLEFLRDRTPEDALEFLLGLPGIGIKSASVLLLFYLDYPFFPVDTHVYRVGQRTGLIPSSLDVQKAHLYMNRLVPGEIMYPLHMLLVMHGRGICQARRPRCGDCVLEDVCDKVMVGGGAE